MTSAAADPPAPSGPARRSVLYVPGSNARAIDKARSLACDGVILDLEDAVAPEAKDAARAIVAEALAAGGFGRREVVVRVNGLDTAWGEADLALLAELSPDAVLVPKIGDSSDVARYDARLSRLPARVRLWAMVETCRSLFHLHAIAGAAGATRLSCLVMGTNDLAKEMGAEPGPDRAPFQAALSLAVAAARAERLSVLDGVYPALEDEAGLVRECEQGRMFGFDGKTLVHPAQIAACNRAFSPSPQRIAWARGVVEAFARPENAGRGAVRADGQMAERLHLAQAERVLAMAAAEAG